MIDRATAVLSKNEKKMLGRWATGAILQRFSEKHREWYDVSYYDRYSGKHRLKPLVVENGSWLDKGGIVHKIDDTLPNVRIDTQRKPEFHSWLTVPREVEIKGMYAKGSPPVHGELILACLSGAEIEHLFEGFWVACKNPANIIWSPDAVYRRKPQRVRRWLLVIETEDGSPQMIVSDDIRDLPKIVEKLNSPYRVLAPWKEF